MALMAVRNQPLFALVFIPIMASLLSEKLPEQWRLLGEGAAGKHNSLLNWSVVGAVAVAALMYISIFPAFQLSGEARQSAYPYYPRAGVAVIRESYPEARIFNNYAWGGYLINELHPQKVFIDGRPDMYGEAIVQKYMQVANALPGWQTVLDEYEVDLVIMPSASALAQRLADLPDVWQKVFTGREEAIFVRVASPADAAAPGFEE
jgi:hypothetical protein